MRRVSQVTLDRNNTSSSFTLPSELKGIWDSMVKEKILDAFPDFLDEHGVLVPLAQSLFGLTMESVQSEIDQKLKSIATALNLESESELAVLSVKITPIF